MKIRVISFSILLFFNHIYSVETQQGRLKKDIQKNISKAVTIKNIKKQRAQAINTSGNITLISNHGENNPPYTVSNVAISFSNVLKEITQLPDHKQLLLDLPDNHVKWLSIALNFLAKQPQNQKEKNIISFLKTSTKNFSTISFADICNVCNSFDIPLIFDTLISIQQPLPKPIGATQEIAYNQQLTAIFSVTKNITYDRRIWELLGRLLYPQCTKYPEIAEIISFISNNKEFEAIALGAYMQQYPGLYKHTAKTFSNIINRPTPFTVSPDKKIIATRTTDNNRVTIINTDNWTIKTIPTNGIFYTFSPDGKIIVIQQDTNFFIIDVNSNTILRTLNAFVSLSFNQDGRTVAAETTDNTVQIIDINNGSIIRTFQNAKNPLYSPDGTILALHTKYETVHVGPVHIPFNDGPVPMDSYDYTDNEYTLFNVHDWSTIRTIKASSLEFNPDGKTIQITTNKGSEYRDIKTGILTQNNITMNTTKISPNGQIIIENSAFHITHLIDKNDRSKVLAFIENLEHAQFSHEGQYIIGYNEKTSTINIQGYLSLNEAIAVNVI